MSDVLFRPRRLGRVLVPLLLAVATLVTLFPFYAMVVLSFKPASVLTFPDALIPTGLTAEAYRIVLSANNLARWILNTLVYALVSVVLVLLLASMAGYAFAKKRFPGRTAVFWSFLAMLMVPYHITLIPTFVILSKLDGVNTYWGLIVPTLANAQATFLMRQFIAGIPDEIIDAARVDGASDLRIFVQLILPLCRPILATLGLFVFLWHWNDFLWPLVIGQDPEMRTLTTGIAGLMRESQPLNVTLAGSVVALTPIFLAYLFAQRHFTEGVAMTGVKG
ncbi:MAG: ABC transporter permease subunit [Actinophytocola sp.]|uniref:carbohydrate ABC transporter permease n=1 Tax=Actinophytocola sp. TaxID=1872138 RepID=UPI001322A6EC|nr:carbohydrate ABC transporter permease [Actinophytocola sp.]MPZ81678.1 ABC transporter permease subunit [Actinophytocola sp.]